MSVFWSDVYLNFPFFSHQILIFVGEIIIFQPFFDGFYGTSLVSAAQPQPGLQSTAPGTKSSCPFQVRCGFRGGVHHEAMGSIQGSSAVIGIV